MTGRTRLVALATSGILIIAVALPVGSPGAAPENRPRAPVPLDCGTAKMLSLVAIRPVWVPFPQPTDYVLHANADPGLSLLGEFPGFKWDAGGRYFWLARVNWSIADLLAFDPVRPRVVAASNLDNIGQRLSVWTWGDFLYAEWPTSGHAVGTADMTIVVARGPTLAQLTAFLRSLRTVSWPACCP